MDLTFVDNNIDLTTDDDNNNEKKEDVFKIPMTPAESQANTTTTTTTTTTSNTNKDTIDMRKEPVKRSMEDGIPLIVPKKWPQQSTILAQLEGATFENIHNQSGALGRLRVEGQYIRLDINGERYSGPLCPTVTCMVVNIAKDEGKVTSMVSDYCPMTHEKNMLGNVRGKITRGERDEEDITLNENNKRKLEQAAARNKKKKKKTKKKRR